MTDASKALTITEYGIQHADGSLTWPNDEGLLVIPNTRHPYGVQEDYLDGIRTAVAHPLPGARPFVIVERTVTYSEPVPLSEPLPATPGSVVRATVAGQVGLFALTPDTHRPWIRASGYSGSWWFSTADLSAATVLFDAGKA